MDNMGKLYNLKNVGFNLTNPNNGSNHAEFDCLKKYNPKGKSKTRFIKKSLIVLRFNQFGNMCNSKPCTLCVRNINTLSKQKGIYVFKIYYSTGKGNEILCSKLVDLIQEKKQHQTVFGRKQKELKIQNPKL